MKRENERELEALNRELEPIRQAEWELNAPMRRLALRDLPGRRPRWRWRRRTGKLERDGKSGIDWFRYHKHVLRPLLFPFAQRCKETRPDTLVMEDNALLMFTLSTVSSIELLISQWFAGQVIALT